MDWPAAPRRWGPGRRRGIDDLSRLAAARTPQLLLTLLRGQELYYLLL